MKLPKGEYTGFVCYVPNEYIQTDGTGFRLTLPQEFILKLSNKQTNEKIELSTEQFTREMNGKTDAEYGTSYQAPSETKSDKFAEQEYTFRKSIPEELKNRPNWTAVRIQTNDAGGTEEYIINCHTGKPADVDNPTTWTDFESACAYAKENDCAALAYALDGQDGICCIELPACKDKNGTYYLLNEFIEEDSNSDDGRIFIRLPEDYKINAKNKTTGEKTELTAFELYQSSQNTEAEDYHFKRKEEEKTVIDGEKVSFLIPQRAKITAYDKVKRLKFLSITI